MGTITLTVIPTGGPILSADHRNNYATLQTLLNGNLDTTNLSPTAGIKSSQIAGGTIGIGLLVALGD